MDSKEHSAKPRVWRPAFGGPPSNWSIKVGNDQFQIGFTGFHGSPLNPTNPFKFPESIARLALHFLDFFAFPPNLPLYGSFPFRSCRLPPDGKRVQHFRTEPLNEGCKLRMFLYGSQLGLCSRFLSSFRDLRHGCT
ncbi:hypothetical protein D9M68_402680 [compost metagenome]